MIYTATLYSGTHIHRQYLPSSSSTSRAVCECTTRDSHVNILLTHIDTAYSRDKYTTTVTVAVKWTVIKWYITSSEVVTEIIINIVKVDEI